MVKKLKSMPYAKCFVVIDRDNVYLYSYTTKVVTIDCDGWVAVHGLHSMTTRRHIGSFMREYLARDYYFAKYLYNSGIKYNILTGEIKGI